VGGGAGETIPKSIDIQYLSTFPVYLLHMFVLVLFGNGKIASPLIAIGVGIVAIAVSVVIAELLRKLTPKFSTYIFGNR